MTTVNSDLMIFNERAVQTDILSSREIDYHPRNAKDSGPLEFVIPGSGDDYIDLNKIDVNIKFKIVKTDGSAIAAADEVGLNNLAIASIFRDVTLHVGDRQIEGGQQDYAHKAYFNTIMQFHPAAQKSHMRGFGWYKDEAGKFNDKTNKGFIARQKLIEGSKVCELHGPIYLDFFNQNRPLISNTDMRLTFTIQKPEVLLNSFKPTACKIKIVDMTVYVRRLTMNPSVIQGHMIGLNTQNALYPVNHTEMQRYSIPAGQKTFRMDDLFTSQSPKLVMVAMTTDKAYSGDYALNPFNFQHFDLNEISLLADGVSIPGPRYKPNFAKGHYLRDYMALMETFNYYNSDDTNGLTLDEFANGYTIYAFNRTPDNDISSSHRHPSAGENLRLDLSFTRALTETIVVFIYAIFDSQIQITKLRDVIADYRN